MISGNDYGCYLNEKDNNYKDFHYVEWKLNWKENSSIQLMAWRPKASLVSLWASMIVRSGLYTLRNSSQYLAWPIAKQPEGM